jgi:hypothetical protein
MKKVLLSTVIGFSIVFFLASAAAQNNEQEFVGTVTCPPCIAKNPRRIDLSCARACFSPKKTTDATKSASSEPGQKPIPDVTESTSPVPPKPADTTTNLVLMTDDYKTIAVDNPDKLKSHLAHRVDVTGYWIRGGGFHVTSVRTL